MTTTTLPGIGSNFRRVFYRPPFVGLLAFFVVFIMQGLGHTQMVLMEAIFGERYVYESAFATGLIGAICLWIAMRSRSEVTATWLGFFAGTCLWTGWVEFTYVWSANMLNVPDLMDPYAPGQIATKAEYLVMMSSAGVLLATLIPLLMNRETKCNMFAWFQRNLNMRTGRPSRGYERNFGYITCLETIYVIWFCYLVLLFIYDDNILGDRHPVTYGIFFVTTAWSLYLINRLRQMWKVTTAIRYAIPTAIIAYSAYEIVGRWNLFADIWVEPGKYWLELTLFFGALIVAAVVAVLTPQHQKAALERQERESHG
ncbi:MAG: hypothetical protein BroJett010_13500 [Gammaproteobacteria bacterium]|nr:hypothetical protein [Gammaproteobacteria bacterium]GIK34791.1 MAG: hypothetical protein BroJett010_13500 [Gammaproteobacteria bacterium]